MFHNSFKKEEMNIFRLFELKTSLIDGNKEKFFSEIPFFLFIPLLNKSLAFHIFIISSSNFLIASSLSLMTIKIKDLIYLHNSFKPFCF